VLRCVGCSRVCLQHQVAPMVPGSSRWLLR
jgi:hypothetical protein